jgi:hypothetical protein
VNDLNFDLFNKPYLFISTKFYCFRDHKYFEQESNNFLSLSRFLGTNIFFDSNEQKAEYSLLSLSPNSDQNFLDKSIVIRNYPEKKVLLFVLNQLLDIDSIVLDSTSDKYENIILTEDAFMVGDVEKTSDTFLKIKYSYKNNIEIDNNNSIDTECKFMFLDENIEPAFDSDGYILPSLDLNSII